jgi:hypothetical protein
MPTSQPDASTPSDDRATPDTLLHTGTEGPVTAEDLVLAAGRDVTPQSLRPGRLRCGGAGRGPASEGAGQTAGHSFQAMW